MTKERLYEVMAADLLLLELEESLEKNSAEKLETENYFLYNNFAD